MFVAIDRDGTLIRYVPYLNSLSDVSLIPGAGAAISRLNRAGIPVVLVTNQPVLGRGLATLSTVNEIHELISRRLSQCSAHLDGIFVCPHATDAECNCRKPKPGLIQQAALVLGQATSNGIVIGDSDRDMKLARSLGIVGLHVQTGPNRVSEVCDKSFPDLYEAAEFVLSSGTL